MPRARTKTPKDQPLTGMEDSAIPGLEQCAGEYAEIRDSRMELNREESKLKEKIRKLMHKHDKKVYKRNGVEIRMVEVDEDVKVRVKAPKSDVEVEG